jgi:hypothetical protein
MYWFARFSFGYFQQDSPSISMQAKGAVGGLLQASDPIPPGLQIFIVDRQSTNALITFDGYAELNHGIVVMQLAALESSN